MSLCECGCGEEVKPGRRFIWGHNRRDKYNSLEHNVKISEGRLNSDKVKSANEAMRGVPLSPAHCVSISEGRLNSDAVKAANKRMCGVTRTPEACANMSAWQLGVPHTTAAQLAADEAKRGVSRSPEVCVATREGQIKSGMFERMAEKFRGGNDIVNHHYIYDESDMSKYTIKMTRSHHTWLHNIFRKFGYIVPHINEDK